MQTLVMINMCKALCRQLCGVAEGFSYTIIFLHSHDVGNIPIICRLQALPLGPPIIIDWVVEIYKGGLSSASSSQINKIQIE